MKKKIIFSAFHMLASLCLVSFVTGTIIIFCYPTPYFAIMEAGKLTATLFLVDVCLGPLITLVIYNPKKKWLKYELLFVAFLQIMALVYGSETLFSGRPVYLVFDTGRFSIVSAYQIPDLVLEENNSPRLSVRGPILVGARVPLGLDERKKYVNSVLNLYHVDLPKLLQYHVPYTSMAMDVRASMFPLDILLKRQFPAKLNIAKAYLDAEMPIIGMTEEELAFVPLLHDGDNWSVIVRRSDISVAAILKIDPLGRCVLEKNGCLKIF